MQGGRGLRAPSQAEAVVGRGRGEYDDRQMRGIERVGEIREPLVYPPIADRPFARCAVTQRQQEIAKTERDRAVGERRQNRIRWYLTACDQPHGDDDGEEDEERQAL